MGIRTQTSASNLDQLVCPGDLTHQSKPLNQARLLSQFSSDDLAIEKAFCSKSFQRNKMSCMFREMKSSPESNPDKWSTSNQIFIFWAFFRLLILKAFFMDTWRVVFIDKNTKLIYYWPGQKATKAHWNGTSLVR